jgi:hypothetical protein
MFVREHWAAPKPDTTPAQASEGAASHDRFVVLSDWNNEAVFDRMTGLVWERSPNKTFSNWVGAHERCEALELGNHGGWRLPTIEELASLVDPSVPSPGPTLPPGHPFTVMSSFYWSATPDAGNEANAWGVGFNIGDVGSGGKSTIDYVWCVRDGDGLRMTPL